MASTLIRWDPFAELQSFRTAMDRQFDQFFGRMGRNDELDGHALSMDVVETADDYKIRAAIAGVDPKDVEISVDDDVLTIKGEYKQEAEGKEENYVRRELSWGSFHRSLKLPPTVEPDKAEAKFENGMLELRLPKRAEARSRSFKITPQGVIDAPTGGNGAAPESQS